MIAWDNFKNIETDKALRHSLLDKEGELFHLLFSQQLTRSRLQHIYVVATAIRRLNKTEKGRDFLKKLLHGKRVLNLFVQPSTRTVESFVAAAEHLGMDARVIQDVSTSSFAKGETVEDAIRTLASYFDCIVTRHKDNSFPLKTVWSVLHSGRPVPVISAGSGTSQHVTQSLLDIYTLQYSFETRGGVDGKTIMLVSDLARNRAARSLIYLLTKFSNIHLVLVSPPQAQLDKNLRSYALRYNIKISEYSNVLAALEAHGKHVDAIYMTRNQEEYGGGGWDNPEAHILKWDYKALLQDTCVIMHPLPRKEELPTAWDDAPNTLIWRQVRNGMWIRAALFVCVFNADTRLLNEAKKQGLL